jgi:hypothetical protein
MLKCVKLMLAVGALSIFATAAPAAPLVGTGNAPAGLPGTPELNWLLAGSGPAFIVNPASPFWVNPATVSGVTAKWISPYVSPLQSPTMTSLGFTCTIFCPGDDPTAQTANASYTYSLTFNNPGQNVVIKWATDNTATWLLNNVPLSSALTGTGTLTSLFAFSLLASDFAVGSNTLKVVVTNLALANGGNPTGLLVDISTVPLPPALLLFGSGLLGMNWLRRRRTDKRTMGAPA